MLIGSKSVIAKNKHLTLEQTNKLLLKRQQC